MTGDVTYQTFTGILEGWQNSGNFPTESQVAGKADENAEVWQTTYQRTCRPCKYVQTAQDAGQLTRFRQQNPNLLML